MLFSYYGKLQLLTSSYLPEAGRIAYYPADLSEISGQAFIIS